MAIATAAGALVGCGGGGGSTADTAPAPQPYVNPQSPPANVTQQSITVYSAVTVGDGSTANLQDLLTAGLGKTGLARSSAPPPVDPLKPTAIELRRNAIFNNYRGLVDTTSGGGYGTLYGPNVDATGAVTTGEGLIPGREYIGTLDDGSGKKRVAMAVQIPDSFNPLAPCMVLAPSSGTRGVYGAIATGAEWGLKHGCAVALTDAGKGVGVYDLMDDTVNRIDGTRATRTAAGTLASFAADITDASRAVYNALFPNRIALKQMHSQLNPEKDAGNDTLAAGRYAFYALNDRYGTAATPLPFNPANTIVIAASVSNGGSAVLRAAEQDTAGLIDGVVVGDPITQMPTSTGYGISFGGTTVATYGKTFADFTTYGNLYQPCAALAAGAVMTENSIFNVFGSGGSPTAANRCTSLAAKGLVTGANTAARSLDALNRLRNYGWTTFNDQMHNSSFGFGNGPIQSAIYPLSYGRFSVTDNVCNTSLGYGGSAGIGAAAAEVKAQNYADFSVNGSVIVGGSSSAYVVYNDSVGGAAAWLSAVSVSTGVADFGLDNALCQRALVTGVDENGNALTTTASSTRPTLAQSAATRAGIAEVLMSGNLQAKPTLIVAGRSDVVAPVNNNARAYVAYNKVREGAGSKVSYIEVANAQHADFLLQYSGFDSRFVPLQVYFVRALDSMFANLKGGTALPQSQVVRATPRGGAQFSVPALAAANVPPVVATPSAADAITFSGTSIAVPN